MSMSRKKIFDHLCLSSALLHLINALLHYYSYTCILDGWIDIWYGGIFPFVFVILTVTVIYIVTCPAQAPGLGDCPHHICISKHTELQ